MVTDSKRKYNISSNSKNSKKMNLSVIIGESIIKNIKEWELSNELEIFVVKFFGGATTKDVESYIQPTIERAPSNVILHCGTNDLKASTDPEQIAENIINIAKSIKTDKNNVIISELTPQNDQLNKKAKKLNDASTRECNKRTIGIIKHDNMNARRHNCVKSAQIRIYFWSVFSCLGLNTEIYSVFSPNTGKYRSEITPYLDTSRSTLEHEWFTPKLERYKHSY